MNLYNNIKNNLKENEYQVVMTIEKEPGVFETKIYDTYDSQEQAFKYINKLASLHESEETSTPKVETFDIEETGGHVMVGYGKLSDGTYYSISTDVVCIWDTDWYKLHFEDAEESNENYDDPNVTIEDEVDHMIKYYNYNTPEYKMYAKQCLAIDKDKASYCVYLGD